MIGHDGHKLPPVGANSGSHRLYDIGPAPLAHVPGEFLDDRRVSTPRGMSLKIIGVEGEMLPDH